MNLKHLQYFRVLAKYQHYAFTADELGVVQPTVSRVITELEQELGVTLFEKKGRNVVLSKYGKILYQYVDDGLNSIDAGVREVKNLVDPSKGTIDLAIIYAASSTQIMPNLIQSFLNSANNKNISFRFYQGNTPDILERLKDGTSDIGICSYFHDEPNIKFTRILSLALKVAVHKNHPLTVHDAVTLEQVAQYPLILSLDKTEFIDNLFKSRNLMPKIVCRVQDEYAMAGLVSVNYGVAIFPENNLLKQENIRILPLIPIKQRDIYLATSKNYRLSTPAQNFYNFVIQYSKQNNS